MKVHRKLLKQWMAYRGMSVRALAAATRQPRVSRSTIGHLASGERATCSPETAKAIERALDVPPGTLFQPQVCNVSPHAAREQVPA